LSEFSNDMLLMMDGPAYNSDEIQRAIEHADYEFVLQNAMPHALAGNTDAQFFTRTDEQAVA